MHAHWPPRQVPLPLHRDGHLSRGSPTHGSRRQPAPRRCRPPRRPLLRGRLPLLSGWPPAVRAALAAAESRRRAVLCRSPASCSQSGLSQKKGAESLYTHQPWWRWGRETAGSTWSSQTGPRRWRGQSHRPRAGKHTPPLARHASGQRPRPQCQAVPVSTGAAAKEEEEEEDNDDEEAADEEEEEEEEEEGEDGHGEGEWRCAQCTYVHVGAEASFLACAICGGVRACRAGDTHRDPVVLDGSEDGRERAEEEEEEGMGVPSEDEEASATSSSSPSPSLDGGISSGEEDQPLVKRQRAADSGGTRGTRGASRRVAQQGRGAGRQQAHGATGKRAPRAAAAAAARSKPGRGGGGGGGAGGDGIVGAGSSGGSGSAAAARSNRAGKQPMHARSSGDVPDAAELFAVGGRHGASSGATATGGGGGDSQPPHVPYTLGEKVDGRWWAHVGRRPMPQSYWPATVVAVNEDGTVDLEYEPDRHGKSECFYEHVDLKYVKARKQVVDDSPMPAVIVPAASVGEEPLIEIRRRKNIAELKELMKSLGLDEPLINRSPRPAQRRRRPRLAFPDSPAVRRTQPSRRAVAGSALDPYQLGFDWGFCAALLAHQTLSLQDLLIDCYGEDAAEKLLEQFCASHQRSAPDAGASGAAAASSSSSSTTGGSGAGDERYDGVFKSTVPLCLVVFARVGFSVLGAMVVRIQGCPQAGRQLIEIMLIAVPSDVYQPESVRRVLITYAELLAARSMHRGLLLAWHERDAEPLGSPWVGCSADQFGGLPTPPSHVDALSVNLLQLDPRPTVWKLLRLSAALAVHTLIEADPEAREDATAAADRRVTEAQQLDAETPPPEPAVFEDCAPAAGRVIALWEEMDAQFFVSRVEAHRVCMASGPAKNPTADASHLRVPGANETLVEYSSMRFDPETSDYVREEKVQPTCLHELVRCESLVMASDREATVRSGLSIDLSGKELLVERRWYPCAVSVEEPAFAQQLLELLGAINGLEEDQLPELLTHYHDLSPWGTDVELLDARCQRHCARFDQAPPSASSPRYKGEPAGWRCQTWDEVAERVGSLNILREGDGSSGDDSEVANDGVEPGTIPRTLELYCGRAGWSSHHKKRGSDAWFIDIDRKCVEGSFEQRPEYMDSGEILCYNQLSESHFIHLDFLDFAMAVLTDRVNIGDLHAIHDGLDCKTFSKIAKSSSQRYTSNSFCGTSASAFATNLRHQYLIAFHRYVLGRQGATPCVRTAENPEAGRQLHPLTTNVVEVPKARGGLGMVRFTLSYCSAFGTEWQKTSALWTDDANTLRKYVSEDGNPEYVCCCKGTKCSSFNGHRRISRPEAREQRVRADRGSIYPNDMCMDLVKAAQKVLATVRETRLDPAYTKDGHDDACFVCGNQRRGGMVYRCDGCSKVFHWKCLPHGAPKPKKARDQSMLWWVCPECHA
jgi:hypothetical protein